MIIMDSIFWAVVVILLVVLVVVIANGWFLPVLVYGFMVWLGFCGLMHLIAK